MVMDDSTLKLGLLMESAQAHQKLAQTQLDQLVAHTQNLDAVVREEIRRTLTEELVELTAHIGHATRALGLMRRAANLRVLLASLLIVAMSTILPMFVTRMALPSAAEVDALRTRRERLEASIANLERAGGAADWRKCGSDGRLCVRVDRTAPVYGEKADYYIVKGN
jgi:hypothetical protein